ncbi:MAG: hypothetical protein ACD_17C00252G0006 [uncultured bacterium]|nr:MAG: hypothetical protein ACD_17C00252G0006 [uncultured bacterium]OGN56741.1 MAG: hypothetical protein A2796_01590 [Chlamydiae bacterium RIFCSPHIGHO2_01_FULL_44_39]OGN58973.1 MAG: hypothetical protein A3C42_06035 [Chlamydiae bacterium RIFCSPHIGHO2_02_FULL_45_9]OGN61100.1 MAG: hypothetical protein A3D96_00550 [Chlamydiae bacterium RIFCSPHIGHO2_12_FULL_44_59]OGN66837.1 MAG: hypothetical protein A2978_07170 [Chlamydiae bacterium RIFCSPLOWO2_01_FULL_44_52]OGN68847.1 MAG: hypothetical protein A3
MNSLTLSQGIRDEYDRLIKVIIHISPSVRTSKIIEGTGGKVSVADIIAYQIGWGKCLIRWYEAGIQGKVPEMPGNGFSTWDYLGIAQHFYQRYQFDSSDEQIGVFHQVVLRILEIVEVEDQTGNLDRTGVWPWCTLPSGKQWPLSKWIRVNTASPYKRAIRLIKKGK